MKKNSVRFSSIWIATLSLAFGFGAAAQPLGTSNRPPQVSILWPVPDVQPIALATIVKIKAEAIDPDGSIAEVRYFAGTDLIGTVTNAPGSSILSMGELPAE